METGRDGLCSDTFVVFHEERFSEILFFDLHAAMSEFYLEALFS
jgi:hypothetical protein